MTDSAPSSLLVSVIPLSGINKVLTYRLGRLDPKSVQVGSLVQIPIMRRRELAIVYEWDVEADFDLKCLKSISRLVQPLPVMTPDLVKLGLWIHRYYAADMGQVFESMIPSAVRKGMQIKNRSVIRLIKTLDDHEIAQLKKRAPQQAKLYQFLKFQPSGNFFPRSEILKQLKIGQSASDGLAKKGVIEVTISRDERVAYDDALAAQELNKGKKIVLNAEQQVAADSIIESLESHTYQTHLLLGITGAGKTEVYVEAIKHVVSRGGSVLFLVPEVALTPQTVSRLRMRFESYGFKTVVWHSSLSQGERYDAWYAVASGEARVVVGARSAVFAPMKNLELIIVDEEHEPAYKQDETPRYQGRDVAVYRGFLCKAVVVLGSATPSMESMRNVRAGKYRLNTLKQRANTCQLPTVQVVDMRQEFRKGYLQGSLFSRPLIDKLRKCKAKGEQAILFINRRGFNTMLLCPDCGWIATCDHCSVSMTYHRNDNRLRCHMCGTETYPPQACKKCGSTKLRWKGSGTQRIESIVQNILPMARIVRVDTDAVRRKDSLRKILNEFRHGQIDILVGTQMIAKGLDFPNVTFVGLIDADMALNLPDFRAAERSFQLLVQVAGRAGRGKKPGEVVIQTYMPENKTIQLACAQNFDDFAELELASRREFSYPPYRHLVQHLFRGRSPEKLAYYSNCWADEVERLMGDKVEIRGPAPAPIEKIQDTYRYQLWYFTAHTRALTGCLLSLRKKLSQDKEVIDVIDVDSTSLL